MRKKPHGWILRGEFKEQHLSTVFKFCPFAYNLGDDKTEKQNVKTLVESNDLDQLGWWWYPTWIITNKHVQPV